MSVTETALKIVERPADPLTPSTRVASSVPAVIFTPDSAADAPAAIHAKASFLAELATHRAVATPLCIGLFGPAGVGKSTMLGACLKAVESISKAASGAGLATPFLADVATARVSVQPGVSPAASIMHQVFTGLGRTHSRLVAEASVAGVDPRLAAREAGDRLNEARMRLDTERRKLDELSGRHARLTETVLFDSTGSRIDSYSRTHRARIERSLRRFGFEGDSSTTYKELVRDANEPGGSLSRGLGWLRVFWVYRGQTRLIVVAIVFFLIAWLLGALIDDQASLIDSLRSSSDKAGSVADWMQAHAHWLQPVKEVFAIAGVVALVINVVRGIRFLQPIVKGTTLLRGDVASRRRDLDGLLAHQTHRVDALGREVEAASTQAAEAEGRLSARAADASPSLAAPLAHGSSQADQDAAQAFFAALASAIRTRTPDRQGAPEVPSRLVVGLDGFERVAGEEAAVFLDAAHALLGHGGIVTLVAADRAHLASGLADTDPALATARLNRMVQIPVAIGRSEHAWPEAQALARSMLRPDANAPAEPDPTIDIARSHLDRAWQPQETAVVEALAPLSGHTPRAVKRFVNLYRVARADPQMENASLQDLAALAVGLALHAAGSPVEAMAGSFGGSGPMDEDFQAARQAAGRALGSSLDLDRHARGLAVARSYAPT